MKKIVLMLMAMVVFGNVLGAGSYPGKITKFVMQEDGDVIVTVNNNANISFAIHPSNITADAKKAMISLLLSAYINQTDLTIHTYDSQHSQIEYISQIDASNQ